MRVTFYAAAADAAGTTSAELAEAALTAAELVRRLGGANEPLARVLEHCTLLVDGRPADGPDQVIPGAARVDILPPFAGG